MQQARIGEAGNRPNPDRKKKFWTKRKLVSTFAAAAVALSAYGVYKGAEWAHDKLNQELPPSTYLNQNPNQHRVPAVRTQALIDQTSEYFDANLRIRTRSDMDPAYAEMKSLATALNMADAYKTFEEGMANEWIGPPGIRGGVANLSYSTNKGTIMSLERNQRENVNFHMEQISRVFFERLQSSPQYAQTSGQFPQAKGIIDNFPGITDAVMRANGQRLADAQGTRTQITSSDQARTLADLMPVSAGQHSQAYQVLNAVGQEISKISGRTRSGIFTEGVGTLLRQSNMQANPGAADINRQSCEIARQWAVTTDYLRDQPEYAKALENVTASMPGVNAKAVIDSSYDKAKTAARALESGGSKLMCGSTSGPAARP